MTVDSHIIKEKLDRFDQFIQGTMHKFGLIFLRWSIGLTFIWFGILKPFGLSPAEGLARSLVNKVAWWIPLNEFFYPGLALIEISIGILFLFRKTLRFAILLLFIQLPLTFMPMIFLPELIFAQFPLVLTLEGQYIIKNTIVASAAIVLGGTVRRKDVKGRHQ